jgi:predicted nucleic acid-binding protein
VSWAYVDTSCLVALALQEPNAARLRRILTGVERLFAANLLEAEFRAAMAREKIDTGVEDYLSWLSWVMPDRSLTPEMRVVLDEGYVGGADLWHLACALFLSADPGELQFLTCDRRQGEIAGALGFVVPH